MNFLQCFANLQTTNPMIVGMGSWRSYILSHILKINPVPFIKNPPIDYDTIFISFVEAANNAKNRSKKIVFVTFNQPLNHQTREILASIDLNFKSSSPDLFPLLISL